jgi:hypothetical protein
MHLKTLEFYLPIIDFSELKNPTHADDLAFFFDFSIIQYTPGIPKGHSEEAFSDKMIKLWISFAKNGYSECFKIPLYP